MVTVTDKKKPLRRMVVVASHKGGVGKTFFSTTLIGWMRNQGIEVAAYDSDGIVGGLRRVLGIKGTDGMPLPGQDPLKGCGYYDIRSERERAQFLDCVSLGHKLILQDLPGGAIIDLQRIVDDGEGVRQLLESLDSEGVRLTIVHLVTHVIESVFSVASLSHLFGNRADHVAVLNKNFGREHSDFPFWYGYENANHEKKGGTTRNRFLEAGGVEVEFPALQAGVFAKIAAAMEPPTKAATNPELKLSERGTIQVFLRKFDEQIRKVGPQLGVVAA
ncbi:CobQ/CobB/MinD/ParA nucleotide binding domain-containing protein [uncultured Gammaproteobacteria bacterium]